MSAAKTLMGRTRSTFAAANCATPIIFRGGRHGNAPAPARLRLEMDVHRQPELVNGRRASACHTGSLFLGLPGCQHIRTPFGPTGHLGTGGYFPNGSSRIWLILAQRQRWIRNRSGAPTRAATINLDRRGPAQTQSRVREGSSFGMFILIALTLPFAPLRLPEPSRTSGVSAINPRARATAAMDQNQNAAEHALGAPGVGDRKTQAQF